MTTTRSRRWFLSAGGLALVSAAASRRSLVFALPQSASGGPLPAALLEDLVAANRILAKEQIVDAFGHVSVRHPASADRFFLARSVAPALVKAADIIEYD